MIRALRLALIFFASVGADTIDLALDDEFAINTTYVSSRRELRDTYKPNLLPNQWLIVLPTRSIPN